MLVLLSTAFALDCDGLDTPTCTAVDELVVSVNSTSTVLTDDAERNRLRPATLYAQLNAMRQALATAGCTVDGTFDGWSAGRYHRTAVTGAWADLDSSASGGLSATTDAPRVTGTVDDGIDPLVDLGSTYGGFNPQRQFAVQRGEGWVAGRWVRLRGRRGVWAGLHGTCAVGVDTYSVLDSWYEGNLPREAELSELTIFVAPGPQTYTGVGAMDAQCQSEADDAMLDGSYQAAVTDVDGGIANPSERFPDGLPLVRPDGTPVATDVDTFFDAGTPTVTNPVQVFADGSMATSFVMPGAGFGRGDCGDGVESFTDGLDTLPTLLASPFANDIGRWNFTALACSSAPGLAVGWYCIRSE